MCISLQKIESYAEGTKRKCIRMSLFLTSEKALHLKAFTIFFVVLESGSLQKPSGKPWQNV